MHFRWRVVLSLLVVSACVVLTTACSSPASSGDAAAADSGGTPSEALVPLDSEGNGTLSYVDITPGDSGTAFTPEQRAIERGWLMVNVGVHDHAQGVRTVLVVPMWYDDRTKFVGSPGADYGDTLSEAVKHPDWAWDAAGTTDIEFHFEDDVFYVDEVSMPGDRASDPNR